MPNMIVCVKQIADPEAPPGSFRVDEATKSVYPCLWSIAGGQSLLTSRQWRQR